MQPRVSAHAARSSTAAYSSSAGAPVRGARMSKRIMNTADIFCARREGTEMAWDFETDPEYQEQLDWADEFVREEIEPLDYVFPHLQFTQLDDTRRKVI